MEARVRAQPHPFARCRGAAQCWRVRRGEARAWINGDERNKRGISSARERKQTARQVSLRKPSLPVETARSLVFRFRSGAQAALLPPRALAARLIKPEAFYARARARSDRGSHKETFPICSRNNSPPSPSIPFVRPPPSCHSVLHSRISHRPLSLPPPPAPRAGWNARERCLVLEIKGPLDIGKPQSGNTPGDVANIEKLEIGQAPSAPSPPARHLPPGR